MLQQVEPEDYVISTGIAHSVGNFVEHAISAAGLPGGVEDYVVFDSRFTRPSEVDLLIGDSAKAREKLDWAPKVTFKELVSKMVTSDLLIESKTI